MSYLDPNEAFAHLQNRVVAGIKEHFPIQGKVQSLQLDGIEVKDDLSPDDIQAQHDAKVKGESWAVPVYARLTLKNNETGKVVDSRRIRIAEIPKTTRRHSYLVDGQEYQVDNQWQLKPGIYTRRRQNGELESRFNVIGRSAFDLLFDPGSKQFYMQYNKSKLPLYPILKTMGVDDDSLEKSWGKEIFNANKGARGTATAVDRFYKSVARQELGPTESAESFLRDTMAKSQLRPDATKLTVGKEFSQVTGEALNLATQRMLQVQAGKPEDDRDSLLFKDIRAVGDFAFDKLKAAGKVVRLKGARKVNQAQDVRDVVKFDLFNTPLKDTFHKNSAARVASQINPLEMVSSAMQTTIMGPGGIQGSHSVTAEAKLVNPTHLGFLDPLNTPEGDKTGITLRLPLGVRKVGNEPKIPLYNVKTNKTELVGPAQFQSSIVVLPDQVKWVDGKPKPIGSTVRVSGGGDIKDAKYSDATYIMRHPSQIFNLTSNLIPFLHSTSGNRASMASRHLEQAISLVHREAPLVQVSTGVDRKGIDTFEALIGQQASHQSPVDGVVHEIKSGQIVVKGNDGAVHKVQLYKNYPLNDAKSVMDSTPIVKVGDKVHAGETIADTNYSKEGKLALGTNLRVAYIPFKGLNFEDGVVISQSAADKLASSHLHKYSVPTDERTVISTRKFAIEHPGVYTKDQLSKLGDNGIIPVGTKVNPGDPLVAAMTPYQIKDRTGLGAIRKSLSGAHTDSSLRWEAEHSGEVVGVHKTKNGISVHVKTIEPMQVGDKLSNRLAAKGIVTRILPDDEMPHDKSGKHIEVALNPCYDDQTEFLTKRGWVLGRDLADVDVFATVNQSTLQLEYQRAKNGVYRWPYKGKMYVLQNKQLDLCVTPNHKNFVAKRSPGALGTIDLSVLPDGTFGLEEVSTIFGKARRYLKVARWVGVSQDVVHIPAGTQATTGPKQVPLTLAARDYAEFMGWYLSEGYCHHRKTGTYAIAICQSAEANPEKYAQIENLLTRMGVHINKTPTELSFSHKGFYERLHELGHAAQKWVPEDIQAMSPELLTVFLDAYLSGDGNTRWEPQRGHHGTRRFTTTSRRLAEGIQLVAFKLGLVVNVHKPIPGRGGKAPLPQYEAAVGAYSKAPWANWSDDTKATQVEKWVDYDGVVYCTEVPNGTLVVRRNGKIVISGNSGVPGRMNPSQLFETAAGKVAQKTGKPFIVNNFDGSDAVHQVKDALKKHNLSDTEELFDPVTKQSLGQVLVGPQHMLKLVHQVDKKLSVRSGMSGLPGLPGAESYDLNLQPGSGAGTGGQSFGALGLYSLLAHGAKSIIREAHTFKSEGPDPQTNEAKRWPSQHAEVWKAIQMGDAIPTPKPTFAFKKFESYLKASGINMDKDGHKFILSPLTDKQVLGMSSGELPKPAELLMSKPDKSGEPRPKPGGLFDEKLTGGHGGKKWSHVTLAEPLPNPVFEGPIRSLTGLTKKDFDAIVRGERAVGPGGQLTSVGSGVTGGGGIKILLDKIDVAKELPIAQRDLDKAPAGKVDTALKKVKYLKALDKLGLKPSEAYVLHHIPILPPAMRPVSVLPSGDFKYADINGIYADFAQINNQLKDPVILKSLPDSAKKELRADFYDGVKAISGIGIPYADAEQKGLLHQVAGSQPKTGFFQQTLLNRRQDLTMRSTIVPEPGLGLDEVGIPRQAALTLFRPFVVNKLVEMGAAANPLDAQKHLADAEKGKELKSVWHALDKVVQERPILLKRDPSLHKHSVQSFMPRIVNGNAIQIHPLATGGFNADFDGDTMAAFVPISKEAVEEAYKMLPTHNLFNDATGKVVYQPTLESALGLFKLSTVGKDSGKKFANPGQVVDAARQKKIDITDVVHLDGKKTTAGRILLSAAVPSPLQDKILHDHSFVLNKKGLDSLLTDIAKKHSHEFGGSVNKLKDMGNGASFGTVPIPVDMGAVGVAAGVKINDLLGGKNPQFKLENNKPMFVPIGGHTLSLNDFLPDTETRDKLVRAAQKEVDVIRASKTKDQDRRVVAVWQGVDAAMREAHEQKMKKNPDHLFTMYQAGVKPGWDQYKQMRLAPMLMKDSQDRTIPTPITRSYAEGLDVSGYWIGMHGARRGAVMKVQEVQEPGYLSKLLQNNMMHMLVNEHDCGTHKGVSIPVTDKSVMDRHLAQEFKAGAVHIPEGTVITPSVVDKIKSVKKDASLVVRSPLKCENEKGFCQTCVGIDPTGKHYDLGTNVGVISAHNIGERAVQLTLKSFHQGGVAEQKGGAKVLNSFARFQQLTMLPEKIPDSATLAMVGGKIDKIQRDPTGAKVFVGGVAHHVPMDSSGMPLHEALPTASRGNDYIHWEPPKVGATVVAGQHLSDPNRTIVNPHQLYKATKSIEKVQNHMTKEIYDLYKDEGVHRRSVEVLVKAMSNLTKIKDPGDSHDTLRGEFRPTSVIKKTNEELVRDGKRPIEHSPVLKGVQVAPLLVHDDWMAKMQHQKLRNTLADAAATLGVSDIHGSHPIPGMAYGAEFGRTSVDSLKPGMSHLKDVPKYNY